MPTVDLSGEQSREQEAAAQPGPVAREVVAKTVGVSPKFIGAVAGAVLSYLLTQTLVDFPAFVDLAINAASVGLGAALAGPGQVKHSQV